MYDESQLTLNYHRQKKLGNLCLLMGDIVRHCNYGYAVYTGEKRGLQLNDYQGQASPGEIVFDMDESTAIVISPGQIRIAQMNWLSKQAISKGNARKLLDL